MRLTDEQIYEIVVKEIKEKTLGVTEQYLKIHDPVYENGKLVIARIDRESTDRIIVVYIPVVGVEFYFAICIDEVSGLVEGFYTEPSIRLYFAASSEDLTLEELKSLTILQPTNGANKGDLNTSVKAVYKHSWMDFKPNPEPDSFEDKLNKLLDFLEQDKKGVLALSEKAGGNILAAMSFHYGNGMLGGPIIDKSTTKRLSALNLEIGFDIYIEGNPIQ